MVLDFQALLQILLLLETLLQQLRLCVSQVAVGLAQAVEVAVEFYTALQLPFQVELLTL
jgi:hypothetical protein